MNNDIKLIMFDIDGTLVDDAKNVPANFKDIVLQLKAKGIACGLNSGRQVAALLRDFSDLKDDCYFIGDDGALVYYQGQYISQVTMDRDYYIQTVKAIDALDGVLPVVSALDKAYVYTGQSDAYYKAMSVYYQFDTRDCLTDLTQPILKVAAYCQDPYTACYLPTKYLEEFISVEVSGKEWVDYYPKGNDKGEALARLMAILELNDHQVMAFGDAGNDVAMLNKVYYSYAMINASEDVKKAANFVTRLDNNHQGVIDTLVTMFNLKA